MADSLHDIVRQIIVIIGFTIIIPICLNQIQMSMATLFPLSVKSQPISCWINLVISPSLGNRCPSIFCLE
jgi:hypothetical protein